MKNSELNVADAEGQVLGEEACTKKLKNYSLVTCLFVSLFITIGGGLHLSQTAAFIDALSGTPLVILAFSRWRNAHYRDGVRKEEPASRIVQPRERP